MLTHHLCKCISPGPTNTFSNKSHKSEIWSVANEFKSEDKHGGAAGVCKFYLNGKGDKNGEKIKRKEGERDERERY